ncbi:MAG TPA: hypothetical protein VF491_14945 [Vicinamibacterales bacterium]
MSIIGDRWRLISSATAEILPAVPPGFAAVLAPIIALTPAFPANVIWLKLVSVAAVFGMAIAYWIDLTRHRGLSIAYATLLTTVTLLTPSLVFLATSTVMSDCVFAFMQVVAVVLVERVGRRDRDDVMSPAVAGLAAGGAMLIRTAGAAAVAAAIIYLLLLTRWRQAMVFATVVVACLLPWWLYARAHAPTDAERMAHAGTIAYSYQQLLTMDRLNDPSSGSSSLNAMARRVARNLTGMVTRDVGALLAPSLYRGPFESGEEAIAVGGRDGGSMGGAPQTMAISALLTAVVIAGGVVATSRELSMPLLLSVMTLVIIAPVGGPTFRYLVPLAPYIVWFAWHGLRRPAVARVVLSSLLGLQLMDHASYIGQKLDASTDWLVDARENDELFGWMSTNLHGPGAVAATNPGLAYLRTGRRAVASVAPMDNWDRWKSLGVRYVAASMTLGLPPESLGWRLLFRTPERGLWVIEISTVEPTKTVSAH